MTQLDEPSTDDDEVRSLREALAASNARLHEIDHRVKNNLQLLASLLQLQVRRAPDEITRRTAKGILERVNAVGAVHRKLFQGGDAHQFEVAEFVRELTTDLAASARRDDVQIRLDLEPATIAATQAAPLALAMNELLQNALRHAFPDRAGQIAVTLRNASDGLRLTVADDGGGMPDGAPNGYGLTVLQLLCQQIKAQLTIEDARPGVRATIFQPRQQAA